MNKAKIVLKASLKGEIIENKIKSKGDRNLMINSLLGALIEICNENDVYLKGIIKWLKNYDKYFIKEEKGDDDLSI